VTARYVSFHGIVFLKGGHPTALPELGNGGAYDYSEEPQQLTKDRFKVAIIAPTAFFYQAPIFRELATHPRIDLDVYFCSDEAVRGYDVLKQFNTNSQWGQEEETLSGYQYKFLRNYSPWPSYLKWPIGLMNFGLLNEIRKSKPDVVVLMSWVNVTDWVVVLVSMLFRIPFLLMTDTSVQGEHLKRKPISWIKRLFLGKGLFRLASGFLYAGTANKMLYEHYGVPQEKLVPFAFSWESKNFLSISKTFKSRRKQIRTELGIPPENQVMLFCGRLSKEKSPHHLLEAFNQIDSSPKTLVFVGDGSEMASLRSYVEEHDVKSVHFLGFQNRKEVPKYYAIADAFVLPSVREATGAVITEAMCFGLPIIASDQVGFGMDLVKHGHNGFIFPAGDVEALAGSMTQFIELSDGEKAAMGSKSLELVEKWSRRDLAVSLLQHLELLYSEKA